MTTAIPQRLFLVLGDQLDPEAGWLADFDPQADALWMAEVAEESTHVWSHVARIALFLSAMRHFRDHARARGWTVHYHELGAGQPSLGAALAKDLALLRPQRVLGCWPGDFRVKQALEAAAHDAGHALAWRDDGHFLVTPAQFERWAGERRSFVMEHFYRRQRQRLGLLMDLDGQPLGQRWNFDADNRRAFGREGPGLLPPPLAFPPDAVTRAVIAEVRARFPDHPGALDRFDWPVTPDQARQALDDFIRHRLPAFGPWQDALWASEPWLYHSRLAAALNLKLLDPRSAIAAAEQAFLDGHAPLASVEGFVRQILGWREYVRGLYWLRMPQFAHDNALAAQAPLPALYWTGATDMACMADAIGQTLQYGYAHHIQRLMVTGLFALLLGVQPQQVHAWYLAVYVDAVEWVELPNTLGMSQYADGGVLASKPYVASGKYIQRMGNHCAGCRYRPDQATGEVACPFTTLYWDFLARHRERFARHPRTALQWKSLDRLDAGQRAQIAAAAEALRTRLA
jgi:deoxyribodipyrimidine photolyase-related protein